MISGKPVRSVTERTSSPPSESARAVPPVEISSTPSSARPRAKSTTPRLSETEMSARRTLTSPGAIGSVAVRSAIVGNIDPARMLGIAADGTRRNRPHRLGQQLVLDRAQRGMNRRRIARVRQLDRALEDDRPRVDALVDEVDGDPEDLHPVRKRLLNHVDARKRRQQCRVDVDHPIREPVEEA